MARRAPIPPALRQRPFTLADAERAGLERWHLEGKAWRRMGPRTYVSAAVPESPMLQLQAASHRLPPAAAFSGRSAAWLHGLDLPPCEPIEVTVPKSAGIAARSGMALHRAELDHREVVKVGGLRTTSIARTLCDVCAHLDLTESVVVCDMALHARLLTERSLYDVVAQNAGARGIATLRHALKQVEPAAESPMETRLRMLLVLRGLPRPEAQVSIRGRFQQFLGRPDLYYREPRLGIEYDGGTHRESLVADNRRQNRLLDG